MTKGAASAVSFALSIAVLFALVGCEGDLEDAPDKVEKFRVAEPLKTDTESALREQIKTITAVTEPYDDVEASVEDQSEPLARTKPDLETQCVTVLKEMAYCTNEDAFLDVIGASTTLSDRENRERFMDRVQRWFEPGGVQVDCRVLLANEDARSTEARLMWQRVSTATEELCFDFSTEIIESDALRWINELWNS